MFPEIEGGTRMQLRKIGGTWGKKFENPCKRRRRNEKICALDKVAQVAEAEYIAVAPGLTSIFKNLT